MPNNIKIKQIIILFTISVLLNILFIREIIKYEPERYKTRFYYSLKEKGWLDKRVDLSELNSDSTMIVLTFGQSNAANSSNATYEPRHDVLNFYDGKLYKAKEPLIGARGNGGCVWTILADKLIDSGFYKKVIIIPIAVENTNIEDWATGECSVKLKKTLADINQHGIKLTHIFWHQGEANNGTSKDNYKINLTTILKTIREYKQNAPFYCSVASYNPNAVTKTLGIDTTIENAQKEFIAENKSVLTGPNTDSLIYAIDRFDAQHFSKSGNLRYADLWFKAIKMHND